MFCVVSGTAVDQGRALRTTDAVKEVAARRRGRRARGPIEIDVDETWDQAWLVYYLRDRDVSSPAIVVFHRLHDRAIASYPPEEMSSSESKRTVARES